MHHIDSAVSVCVPFVSQEVCGLQRYRTVLQTARDGHLLWIQAYRQAETISERAQGALQQQKQVPEPATDTEEHIRWQVSLNEATQRVEV